MTRFSRSRLRSQFGTSLALGLAATALLVAVVWSTSSAADGDGATDPVDTTAPVETVLDSVPDSVPSNSIDLANSTIEELASRVVALEDTVTNMQAMLEQANSLIVELSARTSQLGPNGNYTGSIAPRQLSPQLKVSDITGRWPLSRTEGDLEIARVDIGFTTCRSDSRYYGVVTVGSFRELECVKIPK